MSSLELSREFELRQKTCWEFKWKIQQAMGSSKLHPINGIVHVDEFYIGICSCGYAQNIATAGADL